jgi:hypothetical protein
MLYCPNAAEVAELADAQDLGSCGREAMGVQLPPSAPINISSTPIVTAIPAVTPLTFLSCATTSNFGC